MEKASSTKVNGKKVMLCGCGRDFIRPSLPGGLQWGRAGFKYLGVFIGTEEYIQKNWEGLVEKVCARLSHWNGCCPSCPTGGGYWSVTTWSHHPCGIK